MKISEWKITESRLLLKTRLFSVIEEKAISPRNNKEGNFLLFNFSDWVNVIAITPEKEIVMIRQYRHGNKKIELEIPGGLIDDTDKDPIEAGLRELKEETGFTGKKAFLIGSVYPNPALQNNKCHTILVLDAKKSSETKLEDCEDIETLLVPQDKLNSMILNGEIRHSIVLNAIQLYFLKKKEFSI